MWPRRCLGKFLRRRPFLSSGEHGKKPISTAKYSFDMMSSAGTLGSDLDLELGE